MVWQPAAVAETTSATIAGLRVRMGSLRWKIAPILLRHRLAVVALVDVFRRVCEIFLGLRELAPELEHRAAAVEVELRLLLEALALGERSLVVILSRRRRC